MAEWRWFHLTAHTYGAWLHGDPRGFRTRHHREHVEGDYKNPPPGTYDDRFARSKALMTFPAVRLTPPWRKIVGEAVRDKLLKLGAEVIAASMSSTHAHALARLPETMPRKWMGKAKLHAWHIAHNLGRRENLWAKRSHAEPVKDRGHQVNTFKYILRHVREGAWVWSFREGFGPPPAGGGLSDSDSPTHESPPPAEGGPLEAPF